MNSTTDDLDDFLENLKQDFIESADDRLDDVSNLINQMYGIKDDNPVEMIDVKRHIHTIKGNGTSFGLPSLSVLAHALEDYMETASEIGKARLNNIQVFVDAMRRIVDVGDGPTAEETAAIIRELPIKRSESFANSALKGLKVLMYMPQGIQRKIIGKELSRFGFDVTNAETFTQAIDMALVHNPTLVIASMHTEPVTGLEFAEMLNVPAKLTNTSFLLMTAGDLEDDLPANTTCIRKGAQFSIDFIQFLRNHDFKTS